MDNLLYTGQKSRVRMPSKLVHVEIENGLPIRIFRTKEWRLLPDDRIGTMSRAEAVCKIREQVFERATGDSPAGGEIIECDRCGKRITWETGEMHETLPKGKGGEVSLANCEALCRNCHTAGPDAAHADRKWQTAKIKSDGDING